MSLSKPSLAVSGLLQMKLIRKLLEKNRKLRLEKYLENRNNYALLEAMADANNNHPEDVFCSCKICMESCRCHNNRELPGDSECKFLCWFERVLKNCGIISRRVPWEDCCEEYDMEGVHLIDTGDSPWSHCVYGSLITEAGSVNDPEIKKLRKLFAILSKTNESQVDEDMEMAPYPGNHA